MARRKIISYDPSLKSLARQLRKHSTLSEVLLWRALKGKQLHGHAFLRQRPIDHYIVDFYCPALNLAVEIDGSSHEDRYEEDMERQRRLETLGIHVLRFDDRAVKRDLHVVVSAIEAWILDHQDDD